MKPIPASRRIQRGWIGLVLMLLALVIVGMLAKNALTQYGLLGGAAPQAAGGDRAGALSPGAGAATDTTAAPAVPAAPMDRARSIEGMVKQQAEDRARQSDGSSR